MLDFSFGIIPLRHLPKKGWQILLIKHQAGHWSFPKGHAEKNESDLQAAERELLEETGLSVKRYLIEEPFKEIYFFTVNHERIHKTVSYYVAEVTGDVILQEEELSDYCWLSFEDAYDKMTFKQGKELITQVQKVL